MKLIPGDRVYFEAEPLKFRFGIVDSVDPAGTTVEVTVGPNKMTAKVSQIFKQISDEEERSNQLGSLSLIELPNVAHVINSRSRNNKFFTWAGPSTLIASNPGKRNWTTVFSKRVFDEFGDEASGVVSESQPAAHLFGIGVLCWRNLIHNNDALQSILFFGQQHSRKLDMTLQIVDFLSFLGFEKHRSETDINFEQRLRSASMLLNLFMTTGNSEIGEDEEHSGLCVNLVMDDEGHLSSIKYLPFCLQASLAMRIDRPRFKIIQSLADGLAFDIQKIAAALLAIGFTDDEKAEVLEVLTAISKLDTIGILELGGCAQIVEDSAVVEMADLLQVSADELMAAFATSPLHGDEGPMINLNVAEARQLILKFGEILYAGISALVAKKAGFSLEALEPHRRNRILILNTPCFIEESSDQNTFEILCANYSFHKILAIVESLSNGIRDEIETQGATWKLPKKSNGRHTHIASKIDSDTDDALFSILYQSPRLRPESIVSSLVDRDSSSPPTFIASTAPHTFTISHAKTQIEYDAKDFLEAGKRVPTSIRILLGSSNNITLAMVSHWLGASTHTSDTPGRNLSQLVEGLAESALESNHRYLINTLPQTDSARGVSESISAVASALEQTGVISHLKLVSAAPVRINLAKFNRHFKHLLPVENADDGPADIAGEILGEITTESDGFQIIGDEILMKRKHFEALSRRGKGANVVDKLEILSAKNVPKAAVVSLGTPETTRRRGRRKSVDISMDYESSLNLSGQYQSARAAPTVKEKLRAMLEIYRNLVQKKAPLRGHSLGFIPEDNPFRVWLHRTLYNPTADMLFIMLVMVWSFAVVTRPTFDPDSPPEFPNIWDICDIFFTVLFTVEIVARSICLGFVRQKWGYLRVSGFNLLDAMVVGSMWITVATSSGMLISLHPFRVFRLFTPLRAFKLFQGTRSIFVALNRGFKPTLNILIVMAFFYLGFAVLMIQVYGSSLSRQCVTTTTNSTMSPLRFCKIRDDGSDNCPLETFCMTGFQNPNYGFVGFDNVGQALMSLVQLATLDQWSDDIMNRIMDSEPGFAYATALFFIAPIFILSLMTVNLFVAAICDAFTQVRNETKKAVFDSTRMNTVTTASPIALEADERSRFQRSVLALIESRGFQIFNLSAIFLNSIVIAVEYPAQSAWMATMEKGADFIFILLFLGELAVKIIGYGARAFLSKGVNAVDAIIIVLCTIQIPVVYLRLDIGAFRSLRVLRVGHLIHEVGPLWALMKIVLRSAETVFNLMFFMVFTILLFAIFGKQFLGGEVKDNRETFDSFSTAVITLNLLMSGDSWSHAMFSGMQGSFNSHPDDNTPLSAFRVLATTAFYLTFFFWSNYVVLNLLIAAIVENYEISEQWSKKNQRAGLLALHRAGGAHFFLEDVTSPSGGKGVSSPKALPTPRARAKLETESDMGDQTKSERKRAAIKIRNAKAMEKGGWSATRIRFRKLAQNKFYRGFMVAVIFFSSLVIALTGPPGRENDILPKKLTATVDFCFLAVFIFEFGLHIAGHGKQYFKSKWNLFDSAVLGIILLDIFLSFIRMSPYVRILRCVRPLRLVTHIESLKNVVRSLVASLNVLVYVILLYSIFVMVFAIIGRSLFSLKFYSCNDSNSIVYPLGKAECVGNFIDTSNSGFFMPRGWTNAASTLDDSPQAYVTLFRVTTLQWVATVQNAQDITDVDKQPLENYNPQSSIFFIMFVFLGNYFVANLFVTVIIKYFSEYQAQYMPTSRQSSWIETRRIFYSFLKTMQKPPKNGVRRLLWKLARSKYLNRFMFFLLLSNLVLLCTVSTSLSDKTTKLQSDLELFFTLIYVAEVLVQFFGRGLKHWSRDGWRVFGAVLAIGSLVSHILETSGAKFFTQMAKVSSALRILLLMKFFSPLRLLLVSLAETLPDLFNVILMLILLFWIFAYIAVLLFGNVRRGKKLRPDGYASFGSAMLNLFSVMVGDNWDTLMDDCRVSFPMCTDDGTDGVEYGECGNVLSIPFYITFVVLSTFIAMNLIVAVIITRFGGFYNKQRIILVANDADIKMFLSQWEATVGDPWNSLPLDKMGTFFSNLSPSCKLVTTASSYKQRFHYHCLRAEVFYNLAVNAEVKRLKRSGSMRKNTISRLSNLWSKIDHLEGDGSTTPRLSATPRLSVTPGSVMMGPSSTKSRQSRQSGDSWEMPDGTTATSDNTSDEGGGTASGTTAGHTLFGGRTRAGRGANRIVSDLRRSLTLGIESVNPLATTVTRKKTDEKLIWERKAMLRRINDFEDTILSERSKQGRTRVKFSQMLLASLFNLLEPDHYTEKEAASRSNIFNVVRARAASQLCVSFLKSKMERRHLLDFTEKNWLRITSDVSSMGVGDDESSITFLQALDTFERAIRLNVQANGEELVHGSPTRIFASTPSSGPTSLWGSNVVSRQHAHGQSPVFPSVLRRRGSLGQGTPSPDKFRRRGSTNFGSTTSRSPAFFPIRRGSSTALSPPAPARRASLGTSPPAFSLNGGGEDPFLEGYFKHALCLYTYSIQVFLREKVEYVHSRSNDWKISQARSTIDSKASSRISEELSSRVLLRSHKHFPNPTTRAASSSSSSYTSSSDKTESTLSDSDSDSDSSDRTPERKKTNATSIAAKWAHEDVEADAVFLEKQRMDPRTKATWASPDVIFQPLKHVVPLPSQRKYPDSKSSKELTSTAVAIVQFQEKMQQLNRLYEPQPSYEEDSPPPPPPLRRPFRPELVLPAPVLLDRDSVLQAFTFVRNPPVISSSSVAAAAAMASNKKFVKGLNTKLDVSDIVERTPTRAQAEIPSDSDSSSCACSLCEKSSSDSESDIEHEEESSSQKSSVISTTRLHSNVESVDGSVPPAAGLAINTTFPPRDESSASESSDSEDSPLPPPPPLNQTTRVLPQELPLKPLMESPGGITFFRKKAQDGHWKTKEEEEEEEEEEEAIRQKRLQNERIEAEREKKSLRPPAKASMDVEASAQAFDMPRAWRTAQIAAKHNRLWAEESEGSK